MLNGISGKALPLLFLFCILNQLCMSQGVMTPDRNGVFQFDELEGTSNGGHPLRTEIVLLTLEHLADSKASHKGVISQGENFLKVVGKAQPNLVHISNLLGIVSTQMNSKFSYLETSFVNDLIGRGYPKIEISMLLDLLKNENNIEMARERYDEEMLAYYLVLHNTKLSDISDKEIHTYLSLADRAHKKLCLEWPQEIYSQLSSSAARVLLSYLREEYAPGYVQMDRYGEPTRLEVETFRKGLERVKQEERGQ